MPYARHQSTKVRRPPQWLQQSKEDSKVNNFFLSRSKPTPDTSSEPDDLQSMVHDFIENDSVDYIDGVDTDGASPALTLTENLQMLAKPNTSRERELLVDVQRLLLTVNEDTDLICEANGANCKGTCIKRFIVKHLKTAAYGASVCKSKWQSSGRVPGGEYEYIDVVDASPERLVVDINFQTQFEIARPSLQYATALKSMPTVFVGTPAKLEQLLRLMSEAAKHSLEHNDMHLPPWRTLDYMRAKWLSKFERRPCDTFALRPASLPWRENPRTPPYSESRRCGDELRRTKVSLLLETKGSGLFNLPRGRSSRANLLLR